MSADERRDCANASAHPCHEWTWDGATMWCAGKTNVQAKASAAYPHADVILRVLASEATTPEPDSWGGDWAAARDEVYEFVAERERLRAEVADLKKRLGYPEFAR